MILDRVIGDNQIHETVVVDIDCDDAKSFCGWDAQRCVLHAQAGPLRNLREKSVSLIAIKMRESPFEIHWLAISAADSDEFVINFAIDFRRPAHVIADEKIQIPVVVHVKKCRRRAPVAGLSTDARSSRLVIKLSAAQILKKP